MDLDKQKILMNVVAIVLISIFGLLDALSTFCGRKVEYPFSEEREPSFINGFFDAMRESICIR